MRVCMLAYTFYEQDNRVRRYAEALAKRGDLVDIVALNGGDDPDRETLNGVNVYRIQKRAINEKYKFHFLFKISAFLIKSGIFVTKEHFKRPYDLIHVHSVPDFEVFSALIPKLNGAKIILDIHDIVPEFYASKFKVSKDSLIFKVLVLLERLSTKFSDHTIIANHIWEKRLLSRSVTPDKCSVYLNYPDPALFYPRELKRDPNKIVFIYPGSLNWHQGLDIAVKAFSKIKDDLTSSEFHIYGGGPGKNDLEKLVRKLDMENRVLFKGTTAIDQIGDIMAGADIGVIPKRNDSFGGEAFSTKIFEFMALGIPVIVSTTTIDKYYFKDSVVHFFEAENEDELAKAMLFLGRDKNQRDILSRNAQNFVAQYSWDHKRQDYFDLVDTLVNSNITSDYQLSIGNSYLINSYYLMKPFIPRQLQIYIRRRLTLKKQKVFRDIWPINHKTGKSPTGWQGWPENKGFAVVLTHDVESSYGVGKCRQLAQLDEEHGFRSSFNFVAEDYVVPPELLNYLRQKGHEIGVHGITHRGNPFRSIQTFEKQAGKINKYIKKWNASGFRCPSMYHNLEWIHKLNIQYDASTFDTDPFEPQSDGVNTIFPFIVKKKDGSDGYVELPYTLPQDHLLYIVLREKTIDIWKNKLDWIARKGGMALLNVHPDYIDFKGDNNTSSTYPVEFYVAFLEYINNHHKGQYWSALPREVAAFMENSKSAGKRY